MQEKHGKEILLLLLLCDWSVLVHSCEWSVLPFGSFDWIVRIIRFEVSELSELLLFYHSLWPQALHVLIRIPSSL